ncbi:pilin [Simiduia aestuariiviva]|uniref:Pilin n=1 Tax=Simiduia aestuariiviva TaxID=1510459 RepID=A0A839UKI5_9GAMM|nr:pilin [Simiduia aestuariiviva]MBB3167120.1 hypothetical protein [Simiduia aestuariiviva]
MKMLLKKYAPLLMLVLVIIGFQWYSNARTARYEALAYLSEGLVIGAPVKMQVAMYYQMHGEFPSSNQAVALPPPSSYKGQSLTRLAISTGGIITLTYDKKSGVHNGIIELIPSIDARQSIRWECFTPSYRAVPNCPYISVKGPRGTAW